VCCSTHGRSKLRESRPGFRGGQPGWLRKKNHSNYKCTVTPPSHRKLPCLYITLNLLWKKIVHFIWKIIWGQGAPTPLMSRGLHSSKSGPVRDRCRSSERRFPSPAIPRCRKTSRRADHRPPSPYNFHRFSSSFFSQRLNVTDVVPSFLQSVIGSWVRLLRLRVQCMLTDPTPILISLYRYFASKTILCVRVEFAEARVVYSDHGVSGQHSLRLSNVICFNRACGASSSSGVQPKVVFERYRWFHILYNFIHIIFYKCSFVILLLLLFWAPDMYYIVYVIKNIYVFPTHKIGL